MSAAVHDALEAIFAFEPANSRRTQSATAGELFDAPAEPRAALGRALRDAGYPDAMRSPQALGMALRNLAARETGTRWISRTPSGRWFVGYGTAPAIRNRASEAWTTAVPPSIAWAGGAKA